MVSPAIDTVWFAEEFPSMGAAVGLALQGLGLAQVEMSLLPEWVQAEHRASERRWYFAAAAAGILGLVVSLHADAHFDTKDLRGVDGLNQQLLGCLEKVAAQKQKELDARAKASPLDAQLSRWAKIGAGRGVYSEVATRLFRVIEEYNRGLAAATGGVPEGAVLLSDLLVTQRSLAVEEALLADRSLSKHIRGLKENYYVLARFECKGRTGGEPSAASVLDFEKKLHSVPGFVALPRDGKFDTWLVAGDRPDYLPHMADAWLSDKVGPVSARTNNAWVTWAIWVYDERAASGAEAGSGSTED
jgi:hypothetical protein